MEPGAVERRGGLARRVSAFREVGLFDDGSLIEPPPARWLEHSQSLESETDRAEEEEKDDNSEWEDVDSDADLTTAARGAASPTVTLVDTDIALIASRKSSRLHRLGVLALILAVSIPILQNTPLLGTNSHAILGAKGGVIPHEARTDDRTLVEDVSFWKRDNSPTDVCKRWSHQSAIVNGTLYVFGGRATTDPNQKQNQWNNDFLSLDLTKTWQTGSPAFTGLPRPSGPPAVANGYLWNSHESIFLYGGEFSDSPPADPVPFSLWEYNILQSKWYEHSSPKTSASRNSEPAGSAVQRSAEGAGLSIAKLGRGWYFGGHLDHYTSADWSIHVERKYLNSLLEYTFPGFTNQAIGNTPAGSDGVWRNVTQGGIQGSAGFTSRADGLALYVPGFGAEGIIIALAGGIADKFTQMNVIDVYDIANSTWYKQATNGPTPDIRVNPCATMAAAPDGSSYNVYMFGGQNLTPAGNQTQYDDMWILSIPSFTWIPVDKKDSGQVPYGRAGHTCNVWDGQMVVVGGYVGNQLSCESPGVYVFNLSTLKWTNQFTSLTGASQKSTSSSGSGSGGSSSSGSSGSASSGSGSGSSSSSSGGTTLNSANEGTTNNPFSQQISQIGNNASSGLEGSYGYQVPAAVISAIGGGPTGGATITAPVQSATAGPLATGHPITYTVTGANGAVTTQTGYASPGNGGGGGGGANIGAIVAGVIAGILLLVTCYFGFCAWVYRRQLQLYKDHVAMAQRAAADPTRAEKEGFVLPGGADTGSESRGTGSVPGSGNGRSAGGYSSSATGSGVAPAGGPVVGGGGGYHPLSTRRSSAGSSTEDLLAGQEPTFWGTRGVLLNPRRSLRVINRD